MTCHEFEKQINPYLDHLLNAEEAGQVEAHMEACPDCKRLYQQLSKVIDVLRNLEEEPLPEGFEEALHEKLEAKVPQRSRWKRVSLWGGVAAALVVLVSGLWGMGLSGGAADGTTAENEAARATTAAAVTADIAPETSDQLKAMGLASRESVDDVDAQADYAALEEAGASQPAASQDKLIYTATVSLRSYSFDEDYTALRAKAAELGGYVDVSSVEGLPFTQSEGDGRQGQLQIRVPQEQYQALLAYVSQLGEVTSSEESVSNITQQYTETQIRAESLKTQIARLQELMGQAENIEDIIALESQLSSVTSELEYFETQLKQMDQQVAYSTVSVTVTEMPTASDPVPVSGRGFGQRMADALRQGWNGFASGVQEWALGVVRALPVIVIWILVIAAIAGIIAAIASRRRKKQ